MWLIEIRGKIYLVKRWMILILKLFLFINFFIKPWKFTSKLRQKYNQQSVFRNINIRNVLVHLWHNRWQIHTVGPKGSGLILLKGCCTAAVRGPTRGRREGPLRLRGCCTAAGRLPTRGQREEHRLRGCCTAAGLLPTRGQREEPLRPKGCCTAAGCGQTGGVREGQLRLRGCCTAAGRGP